MVLYILLGLTVLFIAFWGLKRRINAHKFKICSKAGVQLTDYITLGRIEQYIQIRGKDISNPIIIVLHGGPGNHMSFYSYAWQADLERDYTIVHWDQRGCGKTYYRNKDAPKPTFELLLTDLDELVEYVRTRYSQETVVIMGHSWGTLLGGVYVGRHPEKVAAYVGIGQFNDVWKSERYAMEEAIRLANAANKTAAAKQIEEQFQQVSSRQNIDMQELLKLRQLTGKFLPEGDNTPFSVRLFSPYMTLNDLKWFFAPLTSFKKYIGIQEEIYNTLYSQSELSTYHYQRFEVPAVIIAGDCDWITPYGMAREYFDKLSAPKKEFILIEKAGHIPFKPGNFTETLAHALNNMI